MNLKIQSDEELEKIILSNLSSEKEKIHAFARLIRRKSRETTRFRNFLPYVESLLDATGIDYKKVLEETKNLHKLSKEVRADRVKLQDAEKQITKDIVEKIYKGDSEIISMLQKYYPEQLNIIRTIIGESK